MNVSFIKSSVNNVSYCIFDSLCLGKGLDLRKEVGSTARMVEVKLYMTDIVK